VDRQSGTFAGSTFVRNQSKIQLRFGVNVIESAIKVRHDTGKVDPRVNFLLDDQKTDTQKYAPVVNIDKVLCCYRILRLAT
jgi:hypothetical protein